MTPENENYLCHILLTELLAYQFAWPVRWIETQNVLLNQFQTERLIEVGPQPILTNIAKRTLSQASSYECATTISTRRQILSIAGDMEEISYHYNPPIKTESPVDSNTKSIQKPSVSAAVGNAPQQSDLFARELKKLPHTNSEVIDAVRLTSEFALRFIISRKLSAFDIHSLPLDKSIKEICNGKSTLQNELLADIYRQFPTLRDIHKIEEIPVSSLSEDAVFSDRQPDDTGPLIADILSNFISRKFTGALCSSGSVRRYLKENWDIQTASGILVLLASKNVEERFTSEEETKRFIDDGVTEYAKLYKTPLKMSALNTSGQEALAAELDEEKPKVISIESYSAFQHDLTELHSHQNQVLSQHLKESNEKSEVEKLRAQVAKMEKKVTAIENEFGVDLIDKSLLRSFSPLKVRTFDSTWNWARQSIIKVLYALHREPQKIGQILSPSVVQNIANRADISVIRIIQFTLKKNCYNSAVREMFEKVVNYSLQEISSPPLFYVKNFEAAECKLLCHPQNATQYIKEMSLAAASQKTEQSFLSSRLNGDMDSYYKIEKELFQVYSKIIRYSLDSNNATTNIRSQFDTVYEQLLIFLRNSDYVASFFRGIVNEAVRSVNKSLITTKDEFHNVVVDDIEVMSSDEEDDHFTSSEDRQERQVVPEVKIPTGIVPFVHLKKRSHVSGEWNYDKQLTQTYLNNLQRIAINGVSFHNKTTLVFTTGAEDKLTVEVIRALLQAGSKIVVATQHFDRETCVKFQKCYQNHGATGSELIILPLNMSSKRDVSEFSTHLFSKIGDIDFFLPLHVRTTFESILDYTSAAELGHRSSSINFLRFLGSIVREKRLIGIDTRPTHVLLPLSPTNANINEKYNFSDTFMAVVLQKWYDEDWSAELSICGCVYGWTHDGDGDYISRGLEESGIRTFANNEMAFNILGLLTYDVIFNCQDTPLIADLNGGLQALPNLSLIVDKLRTDHEEKEQVKKELEKQHLSDSALTGRIAKPFIEAQPRGAGHLSFPRITRYQKLKEDFKGDSLNGLLDLSSVVVVTGFGELGPWGSQRTRWEMEKDHTLSLEGCIELSTIMGLIKYCDVAGGRAWIDCKTGEKIKEFEIKERYENHIREHCGIRFVDQELSHDFDMRKKEVLHEIILTHDLSPVRMSAEQAEQYRLHHGEKVEIYPVDEESECLVKFLKGCCLMIPKTINSDRFVAGQIPTGWDPTLLGIPDDIISQVDPITLYALVATAEAFIASGIRDPYELFKYVHVSEVGNCVGSGIGGMKSHREVQKERYKDDDVKSDVLPETFANVTAAWINMLLLSSSGPIKTPVGACATAVESLDSAVETILSKKAKICVAGGCDDFEEHIAQEFSNMGATSNSTREMEHGRTPDEMCRPATSTRSGFMESQGAGVQILMSADVAIEMGVPIYGIVAMACTASDKISKSLPAPGQGILTCARQNSSARAKNNSHRLSPEYRRRQLNQRLSEIELWGECEKAEGIDTEFVDRLVESQQQEARSHWGNTFWHNDASISPITGSLATYGLTIDDVAVASCHGTSTKANEKNESQVLNTMMTHLGRTEGNPVLAVFQKHLTGHPKGAAGAWMANGVLQSMQEGIVPGNRNADNIDKEFAKHQHLVYPSENLEIGTIKAATLTSFGFGQKGSMAVFVHPNYALAALSKEQYEEYCGKLSKRSAKAQQHYSQALVNRKICPVKMKAPFEAKQEEEVFLNPTLRADDSLEIRVSESS
ncbi:LAFA_0F21044g1_1 [Lachancea sp. 'fantastica']|nr:LAFA_0F21044g1_1 [Lachancea sp. 'fantastica']